MARLQLFGHRGAVPVSDRAKALIQLAEKTRALECSEYGRKPSFIACMEFWVKELCALPGAACTDTPPGEHDKKPRGGDRQGHGARRGGAARGLRKPRKARGSEAWRPCSACGGAYRARIATTLRPSHSRCILFHSTNSSPKTSARSQAGWMPKLPHMEPLAHGHGVPRPFTIMLKGGGGWGGGRFRHQVARPGPRWSILVGQGSSKDWEQGGHLRRPGTAMGGRELPAAPWVLFWEHQVGPHGACARRKAR